MVTVALVMVHQSFVSWLMCLSSHFSFVVCYDSRKRSQSTKSFFKKMIISHQIVNVPEGQKEHSQVRCLNQGRSASFTCTHKCRKLTFLTTVNEKRVFIYRIWLKTHSSWRRASGLKWRKEICRHQQTTGSRRSVGSKNSWLIRAAGPQEHEEQTNCRSCGDPDLDLDPDPHHHQVSSPRWRTDLRTSQTKFHKELLQHEEQKLSDEEETFQKLRHLGKNFSCREDTSLSIIFNQNITETEGDGRRRSSLNPQNLLFIFITTSTSHHLDSIKSHVKFMYWTLSLWMNSWFKCNKRK